MGNVRLYGSTSGYTELAPPAVAPDGVLSLPSGTGTLLTAEGGKILQIVRATDTTSRSTSSATFVDVTGMSVTITPTKNTSTVLILAVFLFTGNGTSPIGRFAITDAANNQISGGNAPYAGGTYNSPNIPLTLVAYDSPATTSAETYKLRFELTQGSTVFARNDLADGQMYAIEVSA